MGKKEQSHKPNILVVEDDLDLREALVDTLSMENMNVTAVDCAEKAIDVLAVRSDLDLVVSDVNMGAMSGHDLLRHVKAEYPQIPVLLITAYASIHESVQAMKEGAVDYLVKPFDPQTLVDTVNKFVGGHATKSDEPIAVDSSSRQLLALACRVAQSDSTALLIGESGTGKEVLARYVHDKSMRAKKPFVAINCAAIPENMLEAMLFGYEKGAFTGAYAATPGKFEQANEGTILLDEISEMDISLQAKLLRVLQEREVERLGGRKSIALDVRVIATSNKDMKREVSEGKFREDLYFRLSVLPLQWAPLRDRKEDILPIAKSLVAKHAFKQHRSQVSFTPQAEQTLLDYPWPGNVRELDNVMQRALILQPGERIDSVDLGLQITNTFSKKPSLMDVQNNSELIVGETFLPTNTNTVTRNVTDEGTFDSTNSSSQRYNHQETSAIASNQEFDASSLAVTNRVTDDKLIHSMESSRQDSNVKYEDGHNGFNNDHSALSPAPLGNDLRRHEFEIIVKTLRQERGSKKNTAEKLGISARTLRYKMARLRDEGFNLETAMA